MIALVLVFAALAGILLLIPPAPAPAAARTRGRLGRQRGSTEHPIELVLDLSASLLDAGTPITEVLDLLGSSIEQCAVLRSVARCLEMNMSWDKAWEAAPQWLEPLRKALHFAHCTGAPAASLLRNMASLHRREHAQKIVRLGAQFGTKLVLPLGACALPAFIALGVIPLIIAMFPHF